MRIAREEIFGPVLSIIAYDGDDDAIRIANDSPYGLSGSVFGTDEGRVERVVSSLRTGTIGVNSAAGEIGLPFGGYKGSGLGREYCIEALDEFTEVKAVAAQPG
jgi:aldehyde dehydrogenase (NAD+)